MKSFLHLLQLADPLLPIGNFSHSYGLETYVQKGIVHDYFSADNYLTQMLSQNIRYSDASFVSLSFNAAAEKNLALLFQLDEQCQALKLPTEIRMASCKLGIRLIRIFKPLLLDEIFQKYSTSIESGIIKGHYSILFGILGSAFQIDKIELLNSFLFTSVSSIVTNCVKLIPLGQDAGQQLLFSMFPLINEVAQWCMMPEIELLGITCPGFDIRSMQHEQLYSRLYMS